MNIHVDKKTFLSLRQATLVSIKMGSSMYGLSNSESDVDFLHIIATPTGWNNSLVWTHHNLQYKETGVDHVFTTLQNFIRNILKGDSTINYECLYSAEIKESPLNFIADYRLEFKNYSLLRSYLGLVRRDLKLFSQSYDSKKLFHALRGLWTVKQVIKDSYSNDIKSVDLEFYNYLYSLKNKQITDRKILIAKMKETQTETDGLRSDLTKKLENKTLDRIMNPENMKKLDDKFKEFCLTQDYLNKVLSDIEISEIYQVLNTDVTYLE